MMIIHVAKVPNFGKNAVAKVPNFGRILDNTRTGIKSKDLKPIKKRNLTKITLIKNLTDNYKNPPCGGILEKIISYIPLYWGIAEITNTEYTPFQGDTRTPHAGGYKNSKITGNLYNSDESSPYSNIPEFNLKGIAPVLIPIGLRVRGLPLPRGSAAQMTESPAMPL